MSLLVIMFFGDNDDDVNANDGRDAKSHLNSTDAKISTKSDVIRLTKPRRALVLPLSS